MVTALVMSYVCPPDFLDIVADRHDCLQLVLLGALLVAHPPYSDYN